MPKDRKQGLPVLLKARTTVCTAAFVLCSVGKERFQGLVKDRTPLVDGGIDVCAQERREQQVPRLLICPAASCFSLQTSSCFSFLHFSFFFFF